MKIKLLFSLIVLAVLPSFAQEKVATYTNSFWNKSYDVLATTKNANEIKDVYVCVNAKSSNVANFSISGKNLDSFVAALKEMKNKYIEWSKVAKDNNVTEMDKPYDIKFPKVDIQWYGSKWWFAFGVNLKFTFRVTKDGDCLTICSPKVTSSSNRYIDETIYITFANEDDFDQLIDVLNAEQIISSLKAKDNQQDLFN